MIALLSLLFVLVISLLVVRVATVALTLTGLSRDVSRFQARSAFTGAGFTTIESEKVVTHPVRRRIIMLLMILGNAGIITAAGTLILSLMHVDETGSWLGSLPLRVTLLLSSLTALWFLARSSWIDRRLSRLIAIALKRWTTIDARDYAGLLHLTGDYAVNELLIEESDWLAERSLSSLNLNSEGVLVLGIERKGGNYVGAPRGQTELHTGDTLLIYGRQKVLTDLDERRAGSEGNRRHVEAVGEQASLEIEEQAEDEQT